MSLTFEILAQLESIGDAKPQYSDPSNGLSFRPLTIDTLTTAFQNIDTNILGDTDPNQQFQLRSDRFLLVQMNSFGMRIEKLSEDIEISRFGDLYIHMPWYDRLNERTDVTRSLKFPSSLALPASVSDSEASPYLTSLPPLSILNARPKISITEQPAIHHRQG